MDLGYKARLDLLGNVVTSSLLQDNDLTKLKNKDAVNNFLKTASKLTSIEENSELSSGSEPTVAARGSCAAGAARGSSGSSSMSTSPSLQSSCSKRTSRASDLPTLGTLEAGLLATFDVTLYFG